jgi:predicted hotdog family 3-hydroxylacyl-ACP dehydratase
LPRVIVVCVAPAAAAALLADLLPGKFTLEVASSAVAVAVGYTIAAAAASICMVTYAAATSA